MARPYTKWKQYRLEHTDMRNESRRRYYAKHRKNKVRSGEPWSEEENAMVILHAFSDVTLSKAIHRTVQAIHLQRYKLKKELACAKTE